MKYVQDEGSVFAGVQVVFVRILLYLVRNTIQILSHDAPPAIPAKVWKSSGYE